MYLTGKEKYMEPILKGWVWNIPFYPCSIDKSRTVKSIFWYDSSNDLEFTKHTEEYQIVVPESEIIGTDIEKKFVHKNIEDIYRQKTQLIRQREDGKWVLNISFMEINGMFTRLG